MQNEIKENTKLLKEDGTLNVRSGWARRNLFDYDRKLVRHRGRLKEWDFYQISNGKYMVQISFFNITVASAATASIVELKTGKRLCSTSLSLFTRRRYALPVKSDQPNFFRYDKEGTYLEFDTSSTWKSFCSEEGRRENSSKCALR